MGVPEDAQLPGLERITAAEFVNAAEQGSVDPSAIAAIMPYILRGKLGRYGQTPPEEIEHVHALLAPTEGNQAIIRPHADTDKYDFCPGLRALEHQRN